MFILADHLHTTDLKFSTCTNADQRTQAFLDYQLILVQHPISLLLVIFSLREEWCGKAITNLPLESHTASVLDWKLLILIRERNQLLCRLPWFWTKNKVSCRASLSIKLCLLIPLVLSLNDWFCTVCLKCTASQETFPFLLNEQWYQWYIILYYILLYIYNKK